MVFCELDQFCADFLTAVCFLHCGDGVCMRICISGNDSNSASDSDSYYDSDSDINSHNDINLIVEGTMIEKEIVTVTVW